MLIYFVSGTAKYYEKNLKENLDSVFIFSGDEDHLADKQKMKIREEINGKLIPQLVNDVKGLYIDSYISRSRSDKKK